MDPHGPTSTVIVEGTVGSGKTTLLQTTMEQVSAGDVQVLNATCSQLEQDQQYTVLRELLRCLRPSAETADVVRRCTETTMVDGERNAVGVHEDFFTVVRAAADEGPLVVVIDDAQHIDFGSARCLLQTARRLRSASFTLIVAQSTVAPPNHPFFHHELFRQPNSRTIRLGLLSEQDVRAMLGDDLDPAATHQATAGNPLLVRAVIEDSVASAQPVFGAQYARAVLGALHRTSEDMIRLARGVAVLGYTSSPALLARLLDVEPTAVDRALTCLTSAGLLNGGRFRQVRARTAVLDHMPADERAALHLRAAELLHDDGAPARAQAEHLIAAGTAPHSWAIDVLQTAAHHAATGQDVEFAERSLELAVWSSKDERQRATCKVLMLEVAWRTDPSRADLHVPGMMAALRAGRLEPDHIMALIKHLLWHGRVSKAAEAITKLRGHDSPGLRALRLSLTHTYPPLAPLLPAPQDNDDEHSLSTLDLQLTAAKGLADLLANKADHTTIIAAKHILRSCPPDELTFETARLSLLALMYADQLTEAALRCDQLLEVATHDHVATWRATLLAIRAEIALRSGDLTTAERLAKSAMTELPRSSWGVAIAFPLSCLMLTQLALGRLEEAAELADVPIPITLLQSRHGLTYLYARGQYHLAMQSPKAALDDFRHCGDLMRSWKLDMPTLAPWRAGAAEALLRLGNEAEAKRLLKEQLDLVSDAYPRARGATLRLLAASEDLTERRQHLVKAVELLSGSGDRLEFARAMHDLGTAHGRLGESRRARLQTQLAHSVAKQCGAPLPAPAQDSEATPEPVTERIAALTNAERRVAVLAARGHTNREIAEQLFVTQSTVEQHLTKVFRKLDVKQREELPIGLGLRSYDVAPEPQSLTG
ncbi:helix-turn-helix transcriptional regulator [Lentzea aerocolonigenes]|nr:LuxR family transcriptional regulator [Lentzea aerocolonigenes]